MDKIIIIIEGHLASGKSTFARRLSAALKIPYFIKDTYKTALANSIEINSREESRRLSAIAFDGIMYGVERLFEVGLPVIIEGNFVPGGIKKVDEAGVIKDLVVRYGYTPYTFKFGGDLKVLHERFVEREKTPERGRANIMFSDMSLSDFENICRNLDGFSVGGKVVAVDTTDFETVDFDGLIEDLKKYIKED